MQPFASPLAIVKPAHQAVRRKLRKNFVLIDFLDDERNAKHDRRTDDPEDRKQDRRRGSLVEVNDLRTPHERQQHAQRALERMRKRKDRQENIGRIDRLKHADHSQFAAQIAVREHHALRLGRRARSIDDSGQIFAPRNGNDAPRGSFPMRDHAQVLRTHDQQVLLGDHLLGHFRIELVGRDERLGFAVQDDPVDLRSREVGQNRNDHQAMDRGREIDYAPVGHIVAQQSHLIARAEPGSNERLGQGIHPTGEIVIRQPFSAVQ